MTQTTTKHLTDRIVLNTWRVLEPVGFAPPPRSFLYAESWRGQLMLMEPEFGDLLLAQFDGACASAVEGAAGRYLRELGRKCDDIPTVSSIIVRNDGVENDHPLSGLDDLGSLGAASEYGGGGGGGMDVLKIMVELEHERYEARTGSWPPSRVLQEHHVSHDALGQQIDHASNAIGFASRPEDPVSKRWRENEAAERERAPKRSRVK